MPQILTRNIPDRVYQSLRRRAVQHNTSLEGEVRTILAKASEDEEFALPHLLVPRKKGGKSLAQLVSEGRR